MRKNEREKEGIREKNAFLLRNMFQNMFFRREYKFSGLYKPREVLKQVFKLVTGLGEFETSFQAFQGLYKPENINILTMKPETYFQTLTGLNKPKTFYVFWYMFFTW